MGFNGPKTLDVHDYWSNAKIVNTMIEIGIKLLNNKRPLINDRRPICRHCKLIKMVYSQSKWHRNGRVCTLGPRFVELSGATPVLLLLIYLPYLPYILPGDICEPKCTNYHYLFNKQPPRLLLHNRVIKTSSLLISKSPLVTLKNHRIINIKLYNKRTRCCVTSSTPYYVIYPAINGRDCAPPAWAPATCRNLF